MAIRSRKHQKKPPIRTKRNIKTRQKRINIKKRTIKIRKNRGGMFSFLKPNKVYAVDTRIDTDNNNNKTKTDPKPISNKKVYVVNTEIDKTPNPSKVDREIADVNEIVLNEDIPEKNVITSASRRSLYPYNQIFDEGYRNDIKKEI